MQGWLCSRRAKPHLAILAPPDICCLSNLAWSCLCEEESGKFTSGERVCCSLSDQALIAARRRTSFVSAGDTSSSRLQEIEAKIEIKTVRFLPGSTEETVTAEATGVSFAHYYVNRRRQSYLIQFSLRETLVKTCSSAYVFPDLVFHTSHSTFYGAAMSGIEGVLLIEDRRCCEGKH